MNDMGFYKITLPLETNIFQELKDTTHFENVGKGRIGNHLVHVSDQGVPIVRTTTKYTVPAYNFSPIHHHVITSINRATQNEALNHILSLDFNNALIEIYDRQYTKMGYHSDQSMDLDPNSYIGLFSCYEYPEELSEQSIRKLKIINKETKAASEFLLTHNSVILFSVATNTKFQHKIILEQVKGKKPLEKDNKWLGTTFRTSKTYVQFKDDVPYFSNGTPLTLADEDQRQEFFILRGQENRNTDFIYPELTYTLSEADLMIPK